MVRIPTQFPGGRNGAGWVNLYSLKIMENEYNLRTFVKICSEKGQSLSYSLHPCQYVVWNMDTYFSLSNNYKTINQK